MSSSPQSNMPPSQFIEGFQVPGMFNAEVFRSAIDYRPRDDDVFIVTYPKCGTTWSAHTMALVLRHGAPFGDDFNMLKSGPYIEMTGAKAVETMDRPGVIKIHLPFRLAPWSDKAKYIYVTRNPKDTCVSYYHHMKNVPVQGYTGEFDEFFEHFLSGDIDFGDFFDHLMGWYEHRNDPNVLFVTYEEMKQDPEAAILKMASFIDDEIYAKPLREDRQKLENVIKYSSFKEMKVTINKSMDDFFSMSASDSKNADIPEEMRKIVAKVHEKNEEQGASAKPKSTNFVRKGIVGDWRNHFSEEQSRRMDEKFAERTKGTEIANFWKEFM